MKLYFSDFFEVPEELIEEYGAFNISLLTDLPLFIDPFLLFNSKKQEYQKLHKSILKYLGFLHRKSINTNLSEDLLKAWYFFPEAKQNWFGFCETGNAGRGLGKVFAHALNRNFNNIFSNFGQETITKDSHLEKLCLIDKGVGRDMISDFTTNLAKEFLLEYTEKFALANINPNFIQKWAIQNCYFDFKLERWMPRQFNLPVYENEFVILTPKDILTKEKTWINRNDLLEEYYDIPLAIENSILREEINNYFIKMLPKKPTKKDERRAISQTIIRYPQLIDYFIKMKEDNGDFAVRTSSKKVIQSQNMYIRQFSKLVELLNESTNFYKTSDYTKKEAKERILYLKDVIENKGGYKIFYTGSEPIKREKDIHILYRLTWFSTISDVSREVNNGRGPADFKISQGAWDKTIVEFKLASNTQLKRNLLKQVEIYKKASDAETGYKVIFYFNNNELLKVSNILNELGLNDDPSIFLIDAGKDNKPSASVA